MNVYVHKGRKMSHLLGDAAIEEKLQRGHKHTLQLLILKSALAQSTMLRDAVCSPSAHSSEASCYEKPNIKITTSKKKKTRI